MTSGLSLRADLSDSRYPGVSMKTSLWLTMLFLCEWRYSIGSSIVMMCDSLELFILSIIHASVVDFPEPAAPATRTRPVILSASERTLSGIPSSDGSGIPNLITLITADSEPRCLKTLTLNLPSEGIEKEKSSSIIFSRLVLSLLAISYISSTT